MTGLLGRRVWFAVFVAVVFVLGMTTGVVVDRGWHWVRRDGPGPGGPGGPGRRGPTVDHVIGRMEQDLGLSPEQRIQVEKALREGTARMDAFQVRTRQEFDGLRRQMNAEIERALTPSQVSEFRKRLPPPRP